MSHFFNVHDSSLGRHLNAVSRKRLEIQAYSIKKFKNPFEVRICENNESF